MLSVHIAFHVNDIKVLIQWVENAKLELNTSRRNRLANVDSRRVQCLNNDQHFMLLTEHLLKIGNERLYKGAGNALFVDQGLVVVG